MRVHSLLGQHAIHALLDQTLVQPLEVLQHQSCQPCGPVHRRRNRSARRNCAPYITRASLHRHSTGARNSRNAVRLGTPVAKKVRRIASNIVSGRKSAPNLVSLNHCGEHEKSAADRAKYEAHKPEGALLGERRDSSDSNCDLKHRNATSEHFVLVKM